MLLATLSTGDKVYRYNKCIVIHLKGKRRVLSTSRHNGGIRDDLEAVFNNDCSRGRGMPCQLLAPTYAEHLAKISEKLGFNDKIVTGISTAASMDNVAIVIQNFEDLCVTAIVTAGVDDNGGRVGDPASYYEPNLNSYIYKPGTINIMLIIDANLELGAITRSLVTCSEAKTAALQELAVGSVYSSGIATGSGTDETIIIANLETKLYLEDAGKHSKLGELIGNTVMQAVKKALFLQTGLNSERQHNILWRMKRFDITADNIWQMYLTHYSTTGVLKPVFMQNLYYIQSDNVLVTNSILFCHLLDEFNWGLLSQDETNNTITNIISSISTYYQTKLSPLLWQEDDWVKKYLWCIADIIANKISISATRT